MPGVVLVLVVGDRDLRLEQARPVVAGELIRLLVVAPVTGSLLAVIGLAVGALTSSTAAGVSVVLGWWFLVEAIALPALPFGRSVAAWLPATNAQMALIDVPAGSLPWSPWSSLAVLALWAAMLAGVAAREAA